VWTPETTPNNNNEFEVQAYTTYVTPSEQEFSIQGPPEFDPFLQSVANPKSNINKSPKSKPEAEEEDSEFDKSGPGLYKDEPCTMLKVIIRI
jgi:hypothetical protein